MELQIKKGFGANLKAFLLVCAVIIAVKVIPGLPWWIFIIPIVVTAGALVHYNWRISYFMVGFWAGFCIWVFGNLFFHYLYSGTLLDRFGPMLKYVVILTTGIVGGLVTGLAMFTGRELVFDKGTDYKL